MTNLSFPVPGFFSSELAGGFGIVGDTASTKKNKVFIDKISRSRVSGRLDKLGIWEFEATGKFKIKNDAIKGGVVNSLEFANGYKTVDYDGVEISAKVFLKSIGTKRGLGELERSLLLGDDVITGYKNSSAYKNWEEFEKLSISSLGGNDTFNYFIGSSGFVNMGEGDDTFNLFDFDESDIGFTKDESWENDILYVTGGPGADTYRITGGEFSRQGGVSYLLDDPVIVILDYQPGIDRIVLDISPTATVEEYWPGLPLGSDVPWPSPALVLRDGEDSYYNSPFAVLVGATNI